MNISTTTIDLVSPSRVLVNGRAYVIPMGCRFLTFRLADGAPVDHVTKRPLTPLPALVRNETAASSAGKPEGT